MTKDEQSAIDAALHEFASPNGIPTFAEVDAYKAGWRSALEHERGNAGGCKWMYDDNEYAPMWNTTCGQSWSFTEGGLAENQVRFCHKCGGLVVDVTPAPGKENSDA